MDMAVVSDSGLLRRFLAVATDGSISAAAQRLAITQPALSKSINQLEARLGVQLFERLPRGVALTAFGQTLLPHARRIEAECHFAEVEMRAFRSGRSGRLRVGAGPFFGVALLPRAVARLQAQYPELTVELEVGVNELTHPRLFDGKLDLVFCGLPDPESVPPFIARHAFFEMQSRIVAGGGHPLLAKKRIAPGDLAPYPWAIYQQDREMVSHLFAALRDLGAAPPRITTEFTSLTALIQILKAGPYLSCVADALVKAEPGLGLRIVPHLGAVRRFAGGGMVHRSLENYAPAVALLEAVRGEAARLAKLR
ncbi:MAG: LysR family transcriptional regulator [Burkholderiales bacterium]|nr:LysR family transcriptional regulator [Burkholderiales bacterium]